MGSPVQRQNSERLWWGGFALAWGFAVAALTLTPTPEAARAADRTPWSCVVCGSAGIVDVFQNLLLFLPLGVTLRRLGWRPGRALLSCAASSLVIEVLQAILIAGRDPALGDLMANSLGGAVGFGLGGPALAAMMRPTRSSATRIALAVAALWALVTSLTPWLLSPVPLPMGVALDTLTGTRLDHPNRWPGIVRLTPATDATAGITAVFEWRPPSDPGMSPIVRAEDAERRLWWAVDRRGDGIGIAIRLRASAWRLRSPVVEAPLPAGTIAVGAPVRVGSSWSQNAVTARVTVGGQGRTLSARFGPQHGWMLLTPFTSRYRFDASWERWTLGWLVGWGLLLGWWAGAAARPMWHLLGTTGLLLATSGRADALVRPLELACFCLAWAAAAAITARRARRALGGA